MEFSILVPPDHLPRTFLGNSFSVWPTRIMGLTPGVSDVMVNCSSGQFPLISGHHSDLQALVSPLPFYAYANHVLTDPLRVLATD